MSQRTVGTVGLHGERLKTARERAGMSQHELAERLGVSQPHINRWEKGKVDPSSEVLTRMAVTLSVSTDFLVGLVDTPTETVNEADLSPMERRLLQAVREGLITEALKTLTTLAESNH